MSKINLPDFIEVSERVCHGGNPSALDLFIYHNEPADRVEEKVFREQVANMIEEARCGLTPELAGQILRWFNEVAPRVVTTDPQDTPFVDVAAIVALQKLAKP